MQSQNLQTEQSEAELCPVGTFVGNLCPWCGELLPASKTKPRSYCSEAHEKAFKRAGCVSKEKHQAEILAATDAEFAHYYFHKGLGTYVRDLSLPNERRVKDNNHQNVGSVTIRDEKVKGFVTCAHGVVAPTPRKVTHQVDENDRPVVPEPTPIKVPQSRGSGMGGMKPNGKRAVNPRNKPRRLRREEAKSRRTGFTDQDISMVTGQWLDDTIKEWVRKKT